MFPISLIRHDNPELFFALVAPVGANVERVSDGLEQALKRFNYKLETVRVIEQLLQFEGLLGKESHNFDERLENRMNKGDDFRALAERDDALAFVSVAAVVRRRGKSNRPLPRQAYMFRSLKRPEEVTGLRRIYGSNLIVIGVHSAREQRVVNLAERIAQSRFSAQRDHFRDKAEMLILRDESDEQKEHGQRLRKAFAMADFFLDSSDPQIILRDLDRFLNLLFGKPVVTPVPDELGMAYAYSAAMRSAELGRQVGAAIMDCRGNLVSVGTNEVPKAHGGYYWDGDSRDGRDWSKGFDSSDRFKNASLGELLQVLSSNSMLSKELKDLTTPEQISRLTPLIKQTRYMQLIEFIRAVHAEMGALLDAASREVSVRGGTLYVTTFPCHECARNIVAAGIERVVYVEPYAKSLAVELHDDSVQLDLGDDPNKIPFVPFLGVAPRNYNNIFYAAPDRKDDNGNVAAWDSTTANPRVSGSFWSYLQYESEDVALLASKLESKGLNLR
jgi:cytidine deaminase